MAELTVRIEPGDIVERVLDGASYKGKTLREWADSIAEPKTNADRIRAMTDEGIVANFAGRCCPIKDAFYKCTKFSEEDCKRCWLEWLKSPVEEHT